MAVSTMSITHLPATSQPGSSRFNVVHAIQQAIHDHPQANNRAARLAESLSHLLHLHIEPPSSSSHANNNENFNSDLLISDYEQKHSTPPMSPKEDISQNWREIQGLSSNWEGLLDPLHPWLRREIVKYGEFAQATYDAFDFDGFSAYCGSCRYNKHKLFDKMGLAQHGYKVTKYIYAMSHIELPNWLERSHVADTWSRDSNWMGYVAISDDEETRRIGRRDILVAWRGTVAPCEWYEDFQRRLDPIGQKEAKVEHGFLSIYTSKSDTTRYNKTSASEQVMKEVTKLVKFYKEKGEEVSLTITGHSLGGALALLNAYEAASTIPDLPVSVISFGAPRVGNFAFKDELDQLGVKTLRVVVKQDLVPRMPGLVFNEALQVFDEITGTLEWVYTHVGAELKLDVHSSPYLKKGINLIGFHSLETYLHLVDGCLSSKVPFRVEARRDVALVNKACNMVVDELRVPHCWYQLANKGLVCNEHGRWVKPKREPDDVPSPTREAHAHAHAHDHIDNEMQTYNVNVIRPLCTT
ncbi:phospholipase A1-Igamma1, chloroplastic-like [Senna tora]|uniref:Phospholipase A1-Igamma1, chloroplastic-like n=1 Tax=Senna tora TaxID=362788 RepID=A0A834XE51_9FABA|nr:phospholipase A1-Igamma1, chloroplastic-like [Senna tora]